MGKEGIIIKESVNSRDEILPMEERTKQSWNLINRVEIIPEVSEALKRGKTTTFIHFERGDSRYGITRKIDTLDGGAQIIAVYRVELVKLKLGDRGEFAKERVTIDTGIDQSENAPKEPLIEYKSAGGLASFKNDSRALKGAQELIESLL